MGRHEEGTSRVPRVLIVIDRLQDIGGAEGSTALIVEGLQGEGIEFGALALVGYELAAHETLEARGVRFFAPPRTGFVHQAAAVRAAIRDFRPDVVHATLAQAELVSRLVGRATRTPVMTSIVNTPYSAEALRVAPSRRKLEAYRTVDGFLARHATYWFHAISRSAADGAVEALRIDPRRITIVPRGRDDVTLGRRSPQRRRSARESLGISGRSRHPQRRRHEHQKGQQFLVGALRKVLSVEPDTVLVVAGREGTATAALRDRIQELGVSEQVRLLGQRDDVSELLCAADVFAFPSLYEGLGGSLIEAMALEVPIVAFDVPAVRETVDNCGLLVPLGDVVLAQAILSALVTPRSRTPARSGARRFEASYTNERYLAGMSALYRDVTARQPGSAARRSRSTD